MTIQVRYLNYGEYNRVANFLDRYWANNHAYVKMPQLFEWTFGSHSYWDRDTYSFAIAENESEVVGILGGVPFLFNSCGRTSYGMWLANWMVRPSDRHGRCALTLLKQFARHPFDTTIAFGINRDVMRIYQAMQWKVVEDIPRYLFVLPEATERMIYLLTRAYPDWEIQRAQSLTKAVTLTDFQDTPTSDNQFSPPEFDYWDKYTWAKFALETTGASRNSAYLKWRYLSHPLFKYFFITAPEGDRIGLAVWRLETIRQATPDGFKDLDIIGRLVEFMPVSKHNCKTLLTLLVSDLYHHGAMGADFYCYHGRIGAWLNQAGINEVGLYPSGRSIPARFQPLEAKGGQIMSAVSCQAESPCYPFSPDCCWYWTKSDADQDRPN